MKVNGVDVVLGVEDKIQDWEREGRTVILVSVDGEFISRPVVFLKLIHIQVSLSAHWPLLTL